MNQNNCDSFIPVVIKTSLDLPPLWGRFSAIAPEEAELVSHFEIQTGRIVALSFDLGRATFEEIRARIKTAAKDGDGYYNYALVFLDPTQSTRLKSALTS